MSDAAPATRAADASAGSDEGRTVAPPGRRGEDTAEDVAEATGANMAYDEAEGLDRDAIGRGDVADA